LLFDKLFDLFNNMPRKRKEVVPPGPQFTLIWSSAMTAILWKVLVEQHHLGKRADTGWKMEAWIVARDAVQEVYTGGEEHIGIEKIKAKVDYVCVNLYFE
jgi:Myb/SANT-like DNA-binding domain